MRFLSLAALLMPLACLDPLCSWLWICVLASVLLAGSLFLVFSVAGELRLLASLRLR